jgi:hypothetical protein
MSNQDFADALPFPHAVGIKHTALGAANASITRTSAAAANLRRAVDVRHP